MKKIIIFEFLTSNQIQNTKNSLLDQGIKMVDKLSDYFASSKNVQKIIVLRNKDIKTKIKSNINYLFLKKKDNWLTALKNLNTNQHQLILIAPESHKIYQKIFYEVQHLKFNILNSSLRCIETFSSKIKTFKFLRERKIPYILSFENLDNITNKNKKYIIKPEYGAGSENIIFCKSFKNLSDEIRKINYKFLIQYFYETEIASISVLFSKTNNMLISCNEQIIEKKKNRIYQVGLDIGKFEKYRKEFQQIVNKISSQNIGLFGYVGIDLIRDNFTWKVLEINPRFTSSFCYLDKVYGKNTVNNIVNFYLTGKISNKKLKSQIMNLKILF